MWFPRLKGKIGIGIMLVGLYPFLAGYLFAGGERGWFMQFMVLLAVTAFISTWLHIILYLITGRTLEEWIVGLTGFADKHERLHKYPRLGFTAIIFAIVYMFLGDWSVEAVRTNLWGGLFLTLLISGDDARTAPAGRASSPGSTAPFTAASPATSNGASIWGSSSCFCGWRQCGSHV